ncbi:FeoA domain-containing protein [Lachnospiraceae bacterium KK002]
MSIREYLKEKRSEEQYMTIVDGIIDGTYIVTDISIEGPIMRRLEALGINSGTKLRLMNRKRNGTVIIKVRGTRWAIGKDIAGGILVNPAEGEEADGSH